ncbi:hypothetical protein COB21_02585 [Candidatus Aerophobetes bacterium]|uniref:Uncharacterized protein n=1 Tax=Aerophobetes bacterium TaxID=2030807 RepID=A0A2A4X6V8_UNCAE|nr:MAG: hypothetical protein COB21_02585 [Candidatus Aerophobetes bacterium]
MHCQNRLIREKFSIHPKVSFFCLCCAKLILDGGKIRREAFSLFHYQDSALKAVFDVHSPLYSLYCQEKKRGELAQTFLASIVVLLFKEALFSPGTWCYFVMPSKKKHLFTKHSSFFSLYQTIQSQFSPHVRALWPKVSSQIKQGSDWAVKGHGLIEKPESIFILIENYHAREKEEVKQIFRFFKRRYKGAVSMRIYALFS